MEKIDKGWSDIDVSRLVPADWNYKEEDEIKTAKLVLNMKRNGQVETIIVRELDTGFYEVVNGNHRLAAFPKAEIQTVHVFNTGKISDAAARRLAIETNETRFESNAVKLASLMKEITEEFPIEDISTTMPYSAEEIENMQKLTDFDWDSNQGSGDGGGSDDSQKTDIKISVTPDKYQEIKNVIETVLVPFEKFVKVK